MQLTPQQKQLFEQLGTNRPFLEWLAGEEADQIKVLKANHSPVTLAQAQGAAQLIDRIRLHCQQK